MTDNKSVTEHSSTYQGLPNALQPMEIFNMLWRQKGVIVSILFAGIFLSWLYISQITPIYTATTKVMISSREEVLIDIQDVLSTLTPNKIAIESELHVIRSRGLVEKTIDRLDLDRNPEFNPALRPGGILSRFLSIRRNLPESWQALLEPSTQEDLLSEEEFVALEKEPVIDHFLANLRVKPEADSLVITIDFSSRDPRTAAKVVNTLADHYIVSQLDAKLDAARRASGWLQNQVQQLREEVKVSAGAVERYREQQGLIQSVGSATLAEQEVSELNLTYVVEQTKLAETTARLRQAESLNLSTADLSAIPQVLQSSLINSLREQEAQLERKTAELEEIYGDSHPTLVNSRAELQDLKATIASQVEKVFQGLRHEVSIAQARTASLKQALASKRKELGDLNSKEVQLESLQREADAGRNLLEVVLGRFKETSAQQGFQKADATVLAKASIPRRPSYPKKWFLMGLAVLGSGFLGVVVAMILESWSYGLGSTEETEQLTGVRSLGLIPILKGSVWRSNNPAAYVLKNPTSAYSESIRSLSTSLTYTSSGGAPRILLLASATVGEGKTTIAASLACLLASFGQKVLLIDFDFRRAAVHKCFRAPNSPGLLDFLAGREAFENVIQRDEKSSAHFVAAGDWEADALNPAVAEQLETVLNDLVNKQIYDLIIIDSAPVLAVSETRMLAHLADKTILIVRWASTRQRLVMRALKHVTDAGGEVAGFVLSMVDVEQYAKYNYSDSGLYTGSMNRYYQN